MDKISGTEVSQRRVLSLLKNKYMNLHSTKMEERARQKCEQCCAQFVRLVLPIGQRQEMEMHKVDTSNQYHKPFCPYFSLHHNALKVLLH